MENELENLKNDLTDSLKNLKSSISGKKRLEIIKILERNINNLSNFSQLLLDKIPESEYDDLKKKLNETNSSKTDAVSNNKEKEFHESINQLFDELDTSINESESADFIDVEVNFKNIVISNEGRLIFKQKKREEQNSLEIKIASRLTKRSE